jgi:hypothetical protein
MVSIGVDRSSAHSGGLLAEQFRNLLLVLGLLAVAAGAGWIASSGDMRLAAVFVAALFGTVSAFFPRFLLWGVILGGLVAAGVSRLYFPEVQQLRWAVAAAATYLGFYAVLRAAFTVEEAGPGTAKTFPSILLWAAAFFASVVLATALNWLDITTALVGFKGYFQVWGLLLALALIHWPKQMVERLPSLLLWFAVLQLPFALHQYLFIVPQRTGLEDVVAVDIVSGTFGGQRYGGGANAALAGFLVIVVAGLASYWKEGVLSGPKALLIGLLLLAPLAVTVAKISLAFIIAAFAVVFAQDLFRRPGRFALGAGALILALLGLGSAYTVLAPRELSSISELLAFTWQENVEKDYTQSGDLTRWGSIEYWADNHGLDNLPYTILGHGAGRVRVDEDAGPPVFGVGLDPDLDIGRLGAVATLWETGILGFICITGLFWSAFATAGRLARNYVDIPNKRAAFRAAQAAVVVIYLGFWHKDFLIFHLAYQTFFALLLGYIAYWQRWYPSPEKLEE